MFFNWLMENTMYIAVFLVSAAFVIAAFRYIFIEDSNPSDDKEGRVTNPTPDIDLPLPTGVSPSIDKPEKVA